MRCVKCGKGKESEDYIFCESCAHSTYASRNEEKIATNARNYARVLGDYLFNRTDIEFPATANVYRELHVDTLDEIQELLVLFRHLIEGGRVERDALQSIHDRLTQALAEVLLARMFYRTDK